MEAVPGFAVPAVVSEQDVDPANRIKGRLSC